MKSISKRGGEICTGGSLVVAGRARQPEHPERA